MVKPSALVTFQAMWAFALVLLGTGIVLVEGAERFENAEVCLYNPRTEISCRKAMSWGLHCSNRDLCRSKDAIPLEYNASDHFCSDEDAARRAGHLCDAFPWYNGGYPLTKLYWDSEVEQYECLKESASGDYCERWIATENSKDEWEAGDCQCYNSTVSTSITPNREYCTYWECEQIEVEKCNTRGGEKYTDQGSSRWNGNWRWGRHGYRWEYPRATEKTWLQHKFPGYTHEISVGAPEMSIFPYQCYHCDSDHGCRIVGPEVETEKAECTCKEEMGGICVKWQCFEIDDAGTSGMEEEWYTAVKLSDDGKALVSWVGDIDSSSEFEHSKCECQTLSANGRYCKRWGCEERGMAYHFPNVFWVLLHYFLFPVCPFVVIGVIAFIGAFFSRGASFDMDAPVIACSVILITICGWIGMAYAFTLLGGMMEFLLFTIPCLVVLGIFGKDIVHGEKREALKRQASEKLKRVATRRRMRTSAATSAREDRKIAEAEANDNMSAPPPPPETHPTQYPVIDH